MRRLKALIDTRIPKSVHRVSTLEHLASGWRPDLNFLTPIDEDDDRIRIQELQGAGLGNINYANVQGLTHGDIVVPDALRNSIDVLYRPGDLHHGLQLTNRCNSNCLMCSQPPTTSEDGWMAEESIEAIRHIEQSPDTLGLSGGEPLLLGKNLRLVFDAVADNHPTTRLELLTNGRLLADDALADQLILGLQSKVSWLVPLYGHADYLHDFVVQAPGAFEQTLHGLLNLQRLGQPIQLRIVLIEPVLDVLPELCTYIGRNLPFVREVALMACEPIGFALANREFCEVDLLDWQASLKSASKVLRRHEIPFLFMNTPLCALPSELHTLAHKSISDWKNVYLPECEMCAARPRCSGFFAWHDRGWKPSKTINVIQERLQ